MKLYMLITQYVSYRKALGEKFKTNESYLNTFSRVIGAQTPVSSITEEMIHRYLYAGSETVSAGWFGKHNALLGLYQYAVSRNYVTAIPLPRILPKRPPGLVPYIYSQNELQLIFDGALNYQKNKSHIEPYVVRVALILTYALGLRIHETLSIALQDVDMDDLVVTIRQSKFYKSRLVPFNAQIASFLNAFLNWRELHRHPAYPESHLFMNNHKEALNDSSLRNIFKRIRDNAGIKREDGASYQPRIHDLRHTFAVNRLVSWYQENKDVGQLLPILSVYLGHKYLAHTSVYLSMTDDLLREASRRFEKYAKGGQS